LGYPSFLLSYGTIGVSAGDGILLVTNSYPCFAEQYVTEENSRRKKIEKIVAECFYGNARISSSQMLISRAEGSRVPVHNSTF
jgi:hypothetical protein